MLVKLCTVALALVASTSAMSFNEQLKRQGVRREATASEAAMMRNAFNEQVRRMKVSMHEASQLENPHADQRERRSTATTCDACLADGMFWNGVACVSEASFSKAFFFLGCFWGNTGGHQSDCSEMCTIAMTMSYACATATTTDMDFGTTFGGCTGTTNSLISWAYSFKMPSDIGSKIGWTDSDMYLGYYYSTDTQKLIDWFMNMAADMQYFAFINPTDEFPAPIVYTAFITLDIGFYSSFGSQAGSLNALFTTVLLDSVYEYPLSTCPNGVVTTSSSDPCSPETLLTSSTVTQLTDFAFTVSGQTTHAQSSSSLTLYETKFCATSPTSGTVTEVCFGIWGLRVALPTFGSSGLTGTSVSTANYTCGSSEVTVDVYDAKVDVYIEGITYATSGNALGLRMMGVSAYFALESTGTEISGSLVFGVLDLSFATVVFKSSSGTPTCSSSTAAVTTSNRLMTNETSCGSIAWMTPAIYSEITSGGATPICTFSSFLEAGITNALFDPTVAVNQTAAENTYNKAFESSGGSASANAAVTALTVVATLIGALFAL